MRDDRFFAFKNWMNLPLDEKCFAATRPFFMKEIKIFGFDDRRTRLLTAHLHAAIGKRPYKWLITEVTDVRAILDSEVHSIPALEVDGHIVLEGTESSVEELKRLLDSVR